MFWYVIGLTYLLAEVPLRSYRLGVATLTGSISPEIGGGVGWILAHLIF